MDDLPLRIEAAALSVRLDPDLKVGALRYFDAAGPSVAALTGPLGGPLPQPLCAVHRPTGLALAWRSPTETLLLASDDRVFAEIDAAVADRTDICWVDLTGGILGLTLTGARADDLLRRLGSSDGVPAYGEARTGRLAELTVMSLCIRAGEVTLLVDRLYGAHLFGWIRDTVADF